MENQGYEEEPITRPFNGQYLVQSCPTSGETTRSSSTAVSASASASQGVHAIAVRHSRAEPEAHVYEDIVVSALEDSIPAARLSSLPPTAANNNNHHHHCNELDSLNWSKTGQRNCANVRHFPSANEPISLSSEEPEGSSNFHRNLTLPLSKTLDPATNPSRFSVRVTNRERNGCLPIDNLSSLCESSSVDSSRLGEEISTIAGGLNGDKPGGRRRRKKDCKHCKNKTNGGAFRELLSGDSIADSTMHEDATVFPVNVSSGRVQTSENNEFIGREEKTRLGLEPIFTLPDGKLPSFNSQRHSQAPTPHNDLRGNSIFSISNNNTNTLSGPPSGPKPLNYDKNDTDLRLVPVEHSDDRALITPMKNRANGMKVNSIYSQDHWHYKDVPVFVTDVKEQSPFQRAYSLPTRTQTPSSQNRVNLRRSVRGEPPPHPAQLRKNRHGWTLHFARPLDGTGCTRSIVLLLIAILALLGIGGIALYIVFEPEKLQIIQQYLRTSSTRNVSTALNVSNDTFESSPIGLEAESTETTTLPTMESGLFTESLPAFSQDTTVYPQTETETETELILSTNSTTRLDPNATRHCDDCYGAEVCVALVDEEVPFCRNGPDPLDPTGCAGLCLINKQKCHRLDVDAFRCVEVEHYCLDDEWTCSNTLCIPLIKHCDGHMNCYDHSDEYDCACDLQTHFQCGNETSCLPLERRCDGKIDCWDATDEINCTLGQDLGWSCPSSGDFTCSNGECILKARFCDGLRDCTDGSDEPSGCQGRCNKHEFSCHNGRCITKAMKCNGIDDCDDGSDEQHCRDRIK